MLAVPISGIFYSNTNDRDAVFFGIVLPRLFGVNESVSELSHRLHIEARANASCQQEPLSVNRVQGNRINYRLLTVI
ncbi:MAG: hypothetical protein F6K28_60545 [Microcoleus sp. SIO2G3]|nr:hypothetical protein [Microcoleus sp. SIO2G3]